MSTITARQEITWSRLVRRVPILGPVELRDFRLLWAGEGVSLVGDQFHFVALASLVFALTGSGLALGTVLVAVAIPRAAVTSWLQARSEPALLGRVMSLVMLGAFGLQPISVAIAGVLVDAYATPMYLLAGGLILAAVAAALFGGGYATLDGKESMS